MKELLAIKILLKSAKDSRSWWLLLVFAGFGCPVTILKTVVLQKLRLPFSILANETVCYIHAVRAVSRSTVNGGEYFNCTIQTADEARQAVCFTPTKRKILHEFETAKSPVKLSRYNNSRGNVVIGPNSTVTPINADDVNFDYNANLACDTVVNLGEMEHLAPWQLVSVRVFVSLVEESFNHKCFDGSLISKQKVIIKDRTACRVLFLYGEDVDKLNQGISYKLKNLRLRMVKGKTFLNTTKNQPFEF